METNEIMVKMVLDRWNALLKTANSLFSQLSDEQLHREIAPGKNRGIYLLGHLIAVHDDMLRLLSLGDPMFPELTEPFIKQPDKAVNEIPSLQELKKMWHEQFDVLMQKFDNVPVAEWFDKHSAITELDFVKEPHRNKLSIILTRTGHLSYHLGQLELLK